MTKAPKCQAKNPSACIDPMCPEKRGQAAQLAAATNFNDYAAVKEKQKLSDKKNLTGLYKKVSGFVKITETGDTLNESDTPKSYGEGEYTKEEFLRGGVYSHPWTSDFRQQLAATANGSKDPRQLEYLARFKSVRGIVARNPNTSSEVLEALLTKRSSKNEIAENVAENPSTPPEILSRLAGDEDEWVCRGVAANPNTPPEALKFLSSNTNLGVRENVAANPSTPPEVLNTLAHADHSDRYSAVIYNVAANPSTPPETFMFLADSGNNSVRSLIAKNPSTPPKVLDKLAEDKNGSIRLDVAKHPNTSAEGFIKLSEDKRWDVRAAVARNYSSVERTNVDVKLRQDEDPRVRNAAEFFFYE